MTAQRTTWQGQFVVDLSLRRLRRLRFWAGLLLIGLLSSIVGWWFLLRAPLRTPQTRFLLIEGPAVKLSNLSEVGAFPTRSELSGTVQRLTNALGQTTWLPSRLEFESSQALTDWSDQLRRDPHLSEATVLAILNADAWVDSSTLQLQWRGEPESPPGPRIAWTELLDRLTQAPCRDLVLVCDFRPGLGDFDRVVQEHDLVERLTAELRLWAASSPRKTTVWLLLPQSPGDLSVAVGPYRSTLFSEAVAWGLSGAADINQDRRIDLLELAVFVSDRVSRLTKASTFGHGRQRPSLVCSVGDQVHADQICLLPVPRGGWAGLTPKTDASPVADATPPDGAQPLTESQGQAQTILVRSVAQWARYAQQPDLEASPAIRSPHLWRALETRLRDSAARWNLDHELSTSRQAALVEFLMPLEANDPDKTPTLANSPGRRLNERLTVPRWPARPGNSLALLRAARPMTGDDLADQLDQALLEETPDAFQTWFDQLSAENRLCAELLDLDSLRSANMGWPMLRQILLLRCQECRLAAEIETPELTVRLLGEAQRARRQAERLVRQGERGSTGALVTDALETARDCLERAESLVETHTRARRAVFRAGRALPEWLSFWAGCLAPGELTGPTLGDLEEQLELLRELTPLVNQPRDSDQRRLSSLTDQLEAIEKRWSTFEPTHVDARVQKLVPVWNQAGTAAMVGSLLRTRILAGTHADQLSQWLDATSTDLASQLAQTRSHSELVSPKSAVDSSTRAASLARLLRGLAHLEGATLESVEIPPEKVQSLRESLQHLDDQVTRIETEGTSTTGWRDLMAAAADWSENREKSRRAVVDSGRLTPQMLRSLIWLLPHTHEDLVDPAWESRLRRVEALSWNNWLDFQSDRLLDGLHESNAVDQPCLALAERFAALKEAAPRSLRQRARPGLELRPLESSRDPAEFRASFEVFNPLSFPVQGWLIVDHDPAQVLVRSPTEPGTLLVPDLIQRGLGWRFAEREHREALWLGQVVPQEAWRLAPGERRSVSIRWDPLSATAKSCELVLRLVGRRDDAGSPQELSTRELSLGIALPGELPFDLVLNSEPGETATTGRWSLACYPNQTFAEHAQIINRGGARVLEIQVWSLLAAPPQSIPDRILDSYSAELWLNRLKRGPLLGQIERQAVPADGLTERLKFQRAPSLALPATSGAPAVNQSSREPATEGLLFLIRDVETGEILLRHQRIEVLHPDRIVRSLVDYSPQEQLLNIELQRHDSFQAPWPLAVECDLTPLDSAAKPRRYQTTLATGNQPVRLEIPIRATTSSQLVSLSVSGYPRCFRYLLSPNQGAGPVPEETSLAAIQIVGPLEGTAIRLPDQQLSTQVQVDAPRSAFSNPEAHWEIGVDADRNRELEAEPTLRFRADRQVTAWFRGLTQSGSLLLETQVEDFQVPLPISNQREGRSLLLARLRVSERDLWSRPVEVLFDGTGPRVREITAGVRGVAVLGTEMPIVVRADDGGLAGVTWVEAAWDLGGLGELPTEPPPVELRSTEPGEWRGQLSTSDLPEGATTLLVRARDRVGNLSPLSRRVLELKSADTIAKERAARRVEVRGKVRYSGSAVPEIAVVLRSADPPPGQPAGSQPESSPREFTTRTDARGDFRIKDVPLGKYTLQAKGVFRNKVREVSISINLESEDDARPPVLELP